MKRLLLATLILPRFCSALEEDPWFTEMCEFHFIADYDYNFFDKVDNGEPQLDSTFHTHAIGLGLGLTVPDTWNYHLELEFADTSSVSFGYRSFAFQVRKLWLDDVCGDPVSLTTGFVYRDASTRMRKALSTPYHSRANFELNSAIGKEYCCGCYWVFRTFALAAIGQGTNGSPWLRGDLTLWLNYQDCHQLSVYGKSYFGLGSKTRVDVDDFKDWANIGHHSIDVGASYRYQFGCYGSLRFDYMRRVYARSYPEQVNFFIFTFDFPFSVL